MSDDIRTLRRSLRECRTVAIVGLSAERHRPSCFVAKYLQQQGWRIVPVNPRCERILGERCHASLEELAFAVDRVDVSRRGPERLPFARGAVAIGAKCLWQQIGVVNREADALVRAAGLDSVMDRCVEHAQPFADECVADPAGGGNAAAAHAVALRQCAGGDAVPARRPAGELGQLPRAGRPSAARAARAPDARRVGPAGFRREVRAGGAARWRT